MGLERERALGRLVSLICHPLIGVDWAAPPIRNHLRGETWGGAEDLAQVTYNSQRAVTAQCQYISNSQTF